MATRVEPKVFLIGYTTADRAGIEEYLHYTKQQAFLDYWDQAMSEGISPGEALCSLYAKLCYKSLVPDGRNKNVTKVRDIEGNIRGAFDQGHGSVFEHCMLNFVVTGCSRVYTHEQCRHRAGWAFSQTSGRYCRGDNIEIVLDAITEPVNASIMVAISDLEVRYRDWCARMGLDGLKGLDDQLIQERLHGSGPRVAPKREELIIEAGRLGMKMCVRKPGEEVPQFKGEPDWEHNMENKKMITSALRRPLPNGQSNEMGMSVNIRALRHVVQLRTARFAEWEIRSIFNQVYRLVSTKFPTVFHKAKEFTYKGLLEIRGMKQQPYDLDAGDPQALQFYEVSELEAEIARRQCGAKA